MSVAEIIEELPRLTKDELLQIQNHVLEILIQRTREAGEGPAVGLQWVDGQLLLRTNRTITQAEVEDILADFP